MGQTLAVPRQYHRRYASSDVDDVLTNKLRQRQKLSQSCSFPDLKLLPPEIGLKILSNVSAQELRVCRQVWQDLASDDLLWKRLCYDSWGYCSAYQTPRSERGSHFWKSLFTKLESGTDIFNEYPTDSAYSGLCILQSDGVLNNNPEEIAEFLLNTQLLRARHVVALLQHRYDIMEQYVYKHDFSGWFLPIALRSFFFKLSTSTRRQNHFIANLLDAFSRHYCVCNPHFAFASLLVVVHSTILLSNDMCNPAIKNKMSKREYIKNTLQAVNELEHPGIDIDFLTHVYDNIYLIGHVAPERLDFDD